MKKNKYEVDSEEMPIFPHEKSNGKNQDIYIYSQNIKNKLERKKYIIIL